MKKRIICLGLTLGFLAVFPVLAYAQDTETNEASQPMVIEEKADLAPEPVSAEEEPEVAPAPLHNILFDFPINVKAGQKNGFILAVAEKKGVPQVVSKNESVIKVEKVIDRGDNNGYYFETKAISRGNTQIVISQGDELVEVEVTVEGPQVKFPEYVNLVAGKRNGFILETSTKEALPEIFSTNPSVFEVVAIKDRGDGNGYYFETKAVSAGDAVLLIDYNGTKIAANVHVDGVKADFGGPIKLKAGKVNGFLFKVPSKAGMPKVYSENESVFKVRRVVDRGDSNSYYYETIAVGYGKTRIVADINGVKTFQTVEVEEKELKLGYEINLISGHKNGFLLEGQSAKNRIDRDISFQIEKGMFVVSKVEERDAGTFYYETEAINPGSGKVTVKQGNNIAETRANVIGIEGGDRVKEGESIDLLINLGDLRNFERAFSNHPSIARAEYIGREEDGRHRVRFYGLEGTDYTYLTVVADGRMFHQKMYVDDTKNYNVSYLSQLDGRWGHRNFGGNTIRATGCVPTSAAMIINAIKQTNYTPVDVAHYLYHYTNTFNKREIGTTGEGRVLAFSAFGVKSKDILSIGDLANELSQGNLVMAAVGPSRYASPGITHAIVLKGYDGGSTYVYDPLVAGNNGWASLDYIWKNKSRDPADSRNGSQFTSAFN